MRGYKDDLLSLCLPRFQEKSQWCRGAGTWGTAPGLAQPPGDTEAILQNRSLGANPMKRGSCLEQGEGGDPERKRPSMSWGQAAVFAELQMLLCFLADESEIWSVETPSCRGSPGEGEVKVFAETKQNQRQTFCGV